MTPAAAEPRRWRIRSSDHFAWAHAPSGHVLYHRPSGRTHFLNTGAWLLLGGCLDEARDARGAALALSTRQNTSPDPRFIAHVADLLRHLERLGLVESLPE
ncbi:MAG TPA: hypothetical protein VGE10_05545 [Zeimonas sp.]